MRIAVIGGGVSGCVAARLLSSKHDVELFEARHYVGGHANTVDVEIGDRSYPVDTGFMVYNEKTYPNFCRMLEILQVPSQPSDMSFSVRCDRSGWEYQGSSLNGLFAQRRNALSPRFLRMLFDIAKFNRAGMRSASGNELTDGRSVAEFLQQVGVSQKFVEQYLIPMAAAIWSSQPRAILDFPAEFMIGFFANHGLMQIRDRPQWRTISGGSRVYLQRLLGPLRQRVRSNTPVEAVTRTSRDVQLSVAGHQLHFDHVVFACHADQALRLLSDATGRERQVLSAFPYQANEAVLHTDVRLLPKRRRAWASWNYHIGEDHPQGASVTYDLSRLQNHDSPSPILLTLNATSQVDPHQILRTFTYHHPAYSAESIAAQAAFDTISGSGRLHFCGAYWGYGFHEDGVNSALAVTRHFDIGLEACTAASMKETYGTPVGSP